MDLDRLSKKIREIGYDDRSPNGSKILPALIAIHLTLDSFQLSDSEKRDVLDLLSQGSESQISKLPDMSDDCWEDFNYGNVRFGDFVRVKKNAYDSETGSRHNGLVGILTAGSSGRFLVSYIGLRSGTATRHPMGMLESLKLR